jgi:predicted permease
MLRSLPFPLADRLVDIKQIQQEYRRPGSGGSTSPLGSYRVWQNAGAFDGMAAYGADDAVLTGLGDAERLTTWNVSAGFFPLLGPRPLLGRAFTADEDRPGSPPVAVLSFAFWSSRFGGDPQVVGRVVTLDTTSYTVVGVMPNEFRYPADVAIWRNLGAHLSGPAGARRAHEWGFWVVGRMKPQVTLSQARAVLDQVSRQAWSSEPDVAGMLPIATSLRGWLVRQVRVPLWIMLGAVALVLLVACANVSSLLLTRATGREHQMAVRVALGARPRRLAQLLLTESVLLALAGGALGVLLALWSVPALVALAGAELPKIRDMTVNPMVLVAALGASLLAGILTGLVPALRAVRSAPGPLLKSAGAGTAGSWRNRPADGLVVAQVTLTLVLLAGAGLLARSFQRLVRLNPGFDPTPVVIVQLRLPDWRYRTPATQLSYVGQVLEQVRGIPGVSEAAAASGIPLAGGAIGSASVPGRESSLSGPDVWITAVTPDYFDALGIPLVRGERPGAPHTVALDDAAARAYFPGEDPLGKEITYFGARTRVVSGIVGNIRQQSLDEPPQPHIYEPLAENPTSYLQVVARTPGDPAAAVASVRQAVQAVDANVPLDRVVPFAALMGESIARQRLYAWLLGSFATAALLLAGTGMYGIASYAVTRRTREIGIRMALGAERRAVIGLVVGRGLVLTAIGVALGMVGAIASTRVLRSVLFEVTPTDVRVLGAVVAVLTAVTVLATYIPARRAAKVDPVVALRYE